MRKTKLAVYTRPGCPYCPGVIKLVRELEKERDDLKVVEVSTATRKGSLMARKLGLTSVPTTFLRGPKHKEILAFRGVPPRNKLEEAIDISQGKKEVEYYEEEKKEGFFDKLMNIFD